MKKQIILISGLVLLSSSFFSCKKEDQQTLDSNTKQFNDDSNNYKAETDQADNDINNTVNEIPAFGRGAGIASSPLCGVTIDSSQLSQKIIFFNFDGVTPCFSPSRTRSGQIKVQLTTGNSWHDAGSVLTITFNNYKVTRLSDNKSITFNGVKTLTNVNGHNWITFLAGTSTFKYRSRAYNVNVSFNNGTSAVWNQANTTEWLYTPVSSHGDYLTFTANGDTVINGHTATSMWGTNRYGQAFTTHYNSPVVSNTYCGLWRPNSGEMVHHVNNDFTLTLGVDQSGNPTTLDCAYGYKVTWTRNGNTRTAILSY
jgi:hypothetical protein